MSSSQSTSAQQARQVIADRLREILRDSGLTARELARRAGWNEAKCSRLIHARTAPSDSDIRIWCQVCGAEDEIPNLIAASRYAESAYVEWRRLQRSQKRLNELRRSLYEETRLYRFYSSNAIPWPLQSPGYMRALMLRSSALHEANPPDVEEGVKARVSRQRLLDDGTRRCALLVEESVVRARPFDDDVMYEQLSHLLRGIRHPYISLGIIPLEGRRVQKPAETFHLYDERQVYIELLSAAITIAQPREIALYIRCFNDLSANAVYGDQARALINSAIDALGQSPCKFV